MIFKIYLKNVNILYCYKDNHLVFDIYAIR